MKYNLREGFDGHFNCMRSFVLGDESALLMAAYPGARPDNPFPYFTEVMTGFEYTAAVGMIFEGMAAAKGAAVPAGIEEGLRVIRNIRARYDGRKRNPFDEAECGHHYARAMASWTAVIALSGFGWDGAAGAMEFAPLEGKFFWSNGWAWGTCLIKAAGASAEGAGKTVGKPSYDVELKVIGGRLPLRSFRLTGAGSAVVRGAAVLSAGDTRTLTVRVK